MNKTKRSYCQGRFRLLFIVCAGLGLAACSSDDEDTYIARDVEVLYNLAADRMESNQHQLAAALFDEVERQHPFSSWARRAQLMAAYAYYEANEYEDAILSAERFLTLHPGNRDAPYAYYIIALSHYEQITDVGRDQRATEQAMRALQEVVQRFPDSQYAKDAQLKIHLTQDHLAGKEMEVGRFYLKHNQYIAAVGRFKNVIENYQTTSHVPEALHRMVETYLIMGVTQEAQAVAAVLGHNFPDSKWYRYSYNLLQRDNLEPAEPEEGEGGFFSRVFGGS